MNTVWRKPCNDSFDVKHRGCSGCWGKGYREIQAPTPDEAKALILKAFPDARAEEHMPGLVYGIWFGENSSIFLGVGSSEADAWLSACHSRVRETWNFGATLCGGGRVVWPAA